MQERTVSSEAELKELAAKMAKEVKPNQKGAKVFALVGDLGAGKTTFTQGFLEELEVEGPIISPTFLLIKEYPLKAKEFSSAFHIDSYRLDDADELLTLGLKEILESKENLVLIEWAERLRHLLPQNSTWIEIEHQKEGRSLRISRK